MELHQFRPPQPAAKTFAFSSLRFLLYAADRGIMAVACDPVWCDAVIMLIFEH